jgi:hypothetical protein
MSAKRGSKQKLLMIKESAFGTTPSTPTMLEIPINSFTPNVSVSTIRSEQIRTHPFVDRLMQGAQVVDHQATFEVQPDNHDLLLEVLQGAAWATDVTTATDALVGMTMEQRHTETTLFAVYTGTCIKQAQFNFPAAVDGKVTCQMDLMSKAADLDNTATIATAVTAAADTDPFVFHQATLTIGGSAVKATNLQLTVARQIDPLYVLGAMQPDEYIPGAFTLTGQVTIPLQDNTEGARLTAFTEGAIVASLTQSGAGLSFSIPKMNFGKMSRPVNNRGVILQTIDFEAKYDSGTTSVLQITRS